MTTPSNETHLNDPEQILRVLSDFKKKRDELNSFILDLKQELESHYINGTIPEKLRGEGLIVTRKKNAPQWIYSDRVTEIKSELQLQMEAEQQNGIAQRKPSTHSWDIRLVKPDSGAFIKGVFAGRK